MDRHRITEFVQKLHFRSGIAHLRGCDEKEPIHVTKFGEQRLQMITSYERRFFK
jgi:hypothetical protein